MKTNTFRLFISSTFSDFNEERQILQAKVFPHLKEYCESKGFKFQPIDLRWGVSNEAQLDQKALSLCLEEVQASKNTLHPNFLIMAGNRYGWVPLPYAIEHSEFEQLKQLIIDSNDVNYLDDINEGQVDKDGNITIKYWDYNIIDENNELVYLDKVDKDGKKQIKKATSPNRTLAKLQLLEQWYKLDENQLPASYILQHRLNKEDKLNYEEYANWRPEEIVLTKLLQEAVKLSDLSGTTKDKYFTSATEQEVIEGIFNYSYETEYQKAVNSEDGNYKETDKSNVYAYLRNSSCDTELCNEKFEEEDNLKQKAVDFKDRLVESVLPDNIYQTNSQITSVSIDEHNNSLNYEYKEIVSNEATEFEASMIRLLKQSIDRHEKVVAKDFDINQNQKDFKDEKLKGFIGREKDLEVISNYISGDNNQPLVIYGPSGMGKSALMAKAIDEVVGSFNGGVIYRFVGSTSKLTSSVEVVISILAEMGIEEELRMTTDETGQEKAEDVKDFSLRICEHFATYNKNITIFIDAIDQISNQDKLIWLPAKLPSNVKFIISSLQDKKYEEDSKFTDILLNKSNNVHKLLPLDASTAESMATSIMALSGRTMSDKQSAYLFSQPDSINPLYINIACQEIIHWKHIDGTKDFEAEGSGQDLAPTQTLIIQEYISNLNQLYHHNKGFIEVVISTINILGSVSESDLLAIINADDKLIENVAPSTYHHNETNTLPIAIWARLHSMLKPFLKTEEVDGEERMSFFHREFTTLYKEPDLILRDNLLINLQKLIKQSDNNGIGFNDNNFGKHYIHAAGMNFNKPEITDRQREYIQFFNELSTDYGDNVQIVSGNRGHSYLKAMDLYNAIYYLEISHLITESLYHQQPEVWAQDYTFDLGNLAVSYSNAGRVDEAKVLSEKSLEITENLYQQQPEVWADSYTLSLNNLAMSYYKVGRFDEAIELIEKNLEITENLYQQQPEVWAESYARILNNLAISYTHIYEQSYPVGVPDEAIEMVEKGLDIMRKLYHQQPQEWAEGYAKSLNNLAISYYKVGRVDEAIGLSAKSLEITENLYHQQPEVWAKSYTESLGDLAMSYYKVGRVDEAIGLYEKSLEITENLYQQQPEVWAESYTSSLNSLAMPYYKVGRVDEAIGLYEKSLEITENLYQQQPEVWAKSYTKALAGLTVSYQQTKNPRELSVTQRCLSTHDPVFTQIISAINNTGTAANLNHIDVSKSKYLYGIFKDTDFNGDISQWILHEDLSLDDTFKGSIYSGTVKQRLVRYSNLDLDYKILYYKDGIVDLEKHSKVFFYPNGNKKYELSYVNGKLNGVCKRWFNNNQDLHVVSELKDGDIHGQEHIYDTKGNITFTATYHRDESTDQNGFEPQTDDDGNITHYIEYKDGHITNPHIPF